MVHVLALRAFGKAALKTGLKLALEEARSRKRRRAAKSDGVLGGFLPDQFDEFEDLPF